MACTPIVSLKLDDESKAALKRIKQHKKIAKVVGVMTSIGVLNSIFTKNKLPVSAFNITQTDWESYSKAMEALPRYQKAIIEQEVKLMILHYQMNGYDRRHVLFWKGILNGCK
ncbi:MAG: hypothetical protein KTR20_08660 [Cellvibrionaceae bacterium]|nr:hypothetical protein [Cellvibrionaceae bacterium]